MSFKVEDPKNLQGVKVGDQVEVTYTQALAISLTPAGQVDRGGFRVKTVCIRGTLIGLASALLAPNKARA